MKQNQFKPFDQVLVRDENHHHWRCAFFSHITMNNGNIRYNTACSNWWNQCIPYNEKTAHLVNTINPYKPEEPKEWEVRSNNGLYHDKFTSSELKNFIKTAVINNKDITNFSITRIF